MYQEAGPPEISLHPAVLPELRKIQAERRFERASSSLHEFIRQAYHIVRPGERFVDNWHIAAICDHCEHAVKTPRYDLICNQPPGTMKPVWEEELVLERTKGRIRLGDVRVGDEVLTHRGRFCVVESVHEQGNLPLCRVQTQSNRVVHAAADHPFLTPRGWVQAAHLVPGSDVAACVQPQSDFGSQTISLEESRLLGYLVGDGSCQHSQCGVTNANAAVVQDVEICAASLGFATRRAKKTNVKAVFVVLNPTSKWGKTKGPHPVRSFLSRHDLLDTNSYTKRVPKAVLAGNLDIVRAFLGAYWSCDGFVTKKDPTRPGFVIGADTVSEGLAKDLQHLLMRLGIMARVRKRVASIKTKRQNGDKYTSFVVVLSSADQVGRFAATVPLVDSDKVANASVIQPRAFDRTLHEDPVVSVTQAETGYCRCLTVANDSSFVVNDIAVHNSLIFAVFFPCWVWTFWPQSTWFFCSYSEGFARRDSQRRRAIITSDWFKARWGDRFGLVIDQEVKISNTQRGEMQCAGIDGKSTGMHMEFLVVDDAHKADEIDSEAERLKVTDKWWRGSMSTRGVHIGVRRFIVGQRLITVDLPGVLMEDGGWDRLILPMEYEGADTMPPTAIGWTDPRTQEGEFLWPALFTPKVVEETKRGLVTAYRIASQLQQRPVPKEGGLFHAAWFKIVKPDALPTFKRFVRYWDAAATEAGGAYSAGVLIAQHEINHKQSQWYILNVKRGQWSYQERDATIEQTASLDAQAWGSGVQVWLEQEPASSGKQVAEMFVRQLAGYNAHSERVTGEKPTRCGPLAAQCEAGNVFLVQGDWNQAFIDECAAAPNGKYWDQIDAAGSAFMKLAAPRAKLSIEVYR